MLMLTNSVLVVSLNPTRTRFSTHCGDGSAPVAYHALISSAFTVFFASMPGFHVPSMVLIHGSFVGLFRSARMCDFTRFHCVL